MSNDIADARESELFQQYLEVCNKALIANKDRFPYKQLWETSQRLLGGKAIPVVVCDDQPKAAYQLTLQNYHIDAQKSLPDSQEHPWKMNMSYLEKVAKHPEEYINNPAKLDWEWLRDKVGI